MTNPDSMSPQKQENREKGEIVSRDIGLAPTGAEHRPNRYEQLAVRGEKRKMKFKLTKQEKNWVMYDVGNSAFTLMVSTIIPIYFNYLAGLKGIDSVSYLAYWGYAVSISTAIVAVLGPTLGTVSDRSGMRKKLFAFSLVVGVIGCAVLGLVSHWLWFLGVFILVRVAYSFSLVIYDAMLCDVTTPERMNKVSAHGYSWGYIGSCIPFLMCLALVLFYESIGITFQAAMIIAFIIVALWWFFTTLPLLKSYKQVNFVEQSEQLSQNSLRRLAHIFSELKKEPRIFWFLLAFFFYIDGVYTVIDMATAYGEALGLETTGLLLALLVTQIVAFPCCLIFGRLSEKIKVENLILICIGAYCCIAVYAIFLTKLYQFWILAVAVGMFQGAIQSMSRSYYAGIIPADQSGEYFGVYDICGKGASIVGSLLVSVITQLTGHENIGVGSLAIMFVLGFFFFIKASGLNAKHQHASNK